MDQAERDAAMRGAHASARACIAYGAERSARDWKTEAERAAARRMAEELLESFDYCFPASLFDGEGSRPAIPADVIETARALHEADVAGGGAFWVLGKGRLSHAEPLYGFDFIFAPDEILARGEGDTATAAIRQAVNHLTGQGH